MAEKASGVGTRRGSLVKAPGSEGTEIHKGLYRGQGIAVLTSGGDAQGMNAAVRAVVRMGLFLGCKVFLIKEGYQGMCDGGDNIVQAEWKTVSGIINLGGTVIGSARCMEFKERAGRLKACLNLLKRGITNLVCIGGDGSLTGANVFKAEWSSLVNELAGQKRVSAEIANKSMRLNIVGMVGSIDNDFCGTDMTIGCDSALFRIIEAVDNIMTTAVSHKRAFVMEVMGNKCGYLALVASMAAEADWMFIPEYPPEAGWEQELCDRCSAERVGGQRLNIILISEGAKDREGKKITAEDVRKLLTEKIQLDTRVTVLGHVQRGGTPSAYDRILGSRMGADAVLALLGMTEESEPCIIAIDGNQIIRVPMAEAVQKTKDCAEAMNKKQFDDAVDMRGQSFKRNLDMYMLLSKVFPADITSKGMTLGVMIVGSPACGINAAMRGFVRLSVTQGYTVLGISQGFLGLVQNQFQQLTWQDVNGWNCLGGSQIGSSKVTPDQAGLDKVANQIKELHLSGILIIGGFEAFYSALVLAETRHKFPEFCLPITVIPATIANNVPGTDFTIGSDTALNEIIAVCDRMRMSASCSKNKVFICETAGGYCGYLATIAALSGGADAAYIYEEQMGIRDIQNDVSHIAAKIRDGVPRGLILRSDQSHEFFNTDFIHRLYAHEGRKSFSTKSNIIGEMQEGNKPSPFDRLIGTRFGVRCAEKLIEQLQETGGGKTDIPETVTLLGIQGRTTVFTPVQELKLEVDFQHQVPLTNWWLNLRPLMRILARHSNATFQAEGVNSKVN